VDGALPKSGSRARAMMTNWVAVRRLCSPAAE
jgi:hypothetical protein